VKFKRYYFYNEEDDRVYYMTQPYEITHEEAIEEAEGDQFIKYELVTVKNLDNDEYERLVGS